MLKIERLEEEIPVYDITVEDNHNFYANNILVHNCTEITLATQPLKLTDNKMYTNQDSKEIVEERSYQGEIGICNLTNINLVTWQDLTETQRDELAYSILVGMDNAIEYGTYPVKAGERFNRLHRALGIGVTNYQNWLALQKVKLSDPAAIKLTHQIMESVSYYLTKNSIELAKEKGRYHYFEGSLWAKGKFQHDLYTEHFNEVAPELNFAYRYDWDGLRPDMVKYGVRFENLMAVAPGACQSKDNSILTPKGVKTLYEILDTSKIPIKQIEEKNAVGWYNFKKPIEINTRNGIKKSDRVYYNGIKPIFEIEFEDGKTYKFTGNHLLWVDKKGWVRVDELAEGDNIETGN